jgi:DNA-binding response OmpR family regulator
MTTPATGKADRQRGRRVLLVEDNHAASKGLCKLLEAHGFEVAVVPDGTSALAALRDGPPPDILLTDLQLPDLDGREIARHAHQLEPTPWVALITGWDVPAEPDENARWGIDWVFSKPLDVRALLAKLGGPQPGSAAARLSP